MEQILVYKDPAFDKEEKKYPQMIMGNDFN